MARVLSGWEVCNVTLFVARYVGFGGGAPDTAAAGWCRDIDWGSAPAWVGAVGSLLAFLLAVRIYWLNSIDKRMEQARLLSIVIQAAPQRLTATGTTIEELRSALPTAVTALGGTHYDVVGDVELWTLRLWNRSDETVADVDGAVIDAAGSEIVRFQRFEAVGPDADMVFVALADFNPAHRDGWGIRFRFSDAAGRRWVKEPGQRIRGVQKGEAEY